MCPSVEPSKSLLVLEGAVGRANDAVLFELSLSVGRGEGVHVVGANGSGKSTLLNTVVGLLPMQHGHASIAGLPAGGDAVRAHIGHIADPPTLYDELSSREHLELMRRLWGPRRNTMNTDQAIAVFALDAFADQYAHSLSLGQRKRLAIALCMLHSPDLLVLDEPFNGLDDQGIRLLHDLLLTHIDKGGGFLASSHQPRPLQEIATRVLVLPPGVQGEGL